MPVSHNHRFIFIHIPKTGGQSIEKALGLYGMGNAGSNKADHKIGYGVLNRHIALQHCTLKELEEQGVISIKERKEYFKFSFVRNPWDRIISEYFWRVQYLKQKGLKGNSDKKGFHKFVEYYLQGDPPQDLYSSHLTPQTEFIFKKSVKKVDFIGYFENLHEDFDKICRLKNIANCQLPHLDKTKRKYYTAYYNEVTRRIVGEYYKSDIEQFKYCFEK